VVARGEQAVRLREIAERAPASLRAGRVSFTIYDPAKPEGRNVSAEYPTESAPEGVGRYLSGTLRFEVLKRARFWCELCGVSADERALFDATGFATKSRALRGTFGVGALTVEEWAGGSWRTGSDREELEGTFEAEEGDER
jgi:hypothetical protein